MTRVVVLSAGLSDASSSRMLAHRIADAVRVAAPATELETIDLRPLAREITDAVVSGYAGPKVADAVEAVRAGDALVVVTPIFQASYSGLFKMFIDVLDADLLTGKPVLLAATGGTARHSLAIDHALRPLFGYLQALAVPTGIFASPHDWGGDGGGALTRRIERGVAELLSLLGGSGTGRVASDEIDLFSETMLSISDPLR